MGTHTGTQKSASAAPGPARRRLLVLALLVTVTLVAWGVLVYAAIDFGAEARAGEPVAWVFLGIATIGAAACLFATLILGARVLALLQGRSEPVRPQGGRRAAR